MFPFMYCTFTSISWIVALLSHLTAIKTGLVQLCSSSMIMKVCNSPTNLQYDIHGCHRPHIIRIVQVFISAIMDVYFTRGNEMTIIAMISFGLRSLVLSIKPFQDLESFHLLSYYESHCSTLYRQDFHLHAVEAIVSFCIKRAVLIFIIIQ